MSDYDLPGMGDFLPPERTPNKPCFDCDNEVDLPQGIEIFITSRGVDYPLCEHCLQDRLVSNP